MRIRQKVQGPCGETSVPMRHVLWQAHEEKLREMTNVNYFSEDSFEMSKTSRAHTPLVGAALVGQGLLIRVVWSRLGGF